MRKTRSAPARRRTTKKTSRKTRSTRGRKSNPIYIFDVLGVGAIVLGVVTAIALCMPESNTILARYIAATIRVIVGYGAFAVPLFLILIGVMLIVAPLEVFPRNVATGAGMLFIVFISWCSLAVGIDVFEPAHGGGYIGNILAAGLRRITGTAIGYVVLIGFAVIAFVIMKNSPLAASIDKLRVAWTDWREEANDRVAEEREMHEARNAKNSRGAKSEPNVIVDDKTEEPKSRKGRLASIFGKGAGETEPDLKQAELPVEVVAENIPELDLTPQRPKVKISMPASNKSAKASVSVDEHGEFQIPPTTLLVEPPPPPPRVESELKENIEIIERTLEEFKVAANVVEISCGPTVARYEIRLAPGIKVNKIVGLADNLAMQLAAIDVRVEAPIPGKAAIGVEVPNRNRGTVVMRDILESKAFREASSKITFALGKDVAGHAKVADLARMPHMLVGGATNSGKSVCLNVLIMSLLYRATPDELKMILIDPKRVELSLFDGIPHLACPVVKDVKQAAGVLRAAVQEMEKRYDIFARIGARNLESYNEKVAPEERMPYMVIVVDELADLMMQCAAEVEGSITRLAQLARATGMHLVIATQRPSVDVITGIIKANISSRIAFAVSSHHDSRTILDQKGAERLIGRGDMLFLPIDASKPTRIQGCYVSEKEIEATCDFLKAQRKPVYTIQPGQVPGSGGGGGGENDDALADEFYEPSVRFVVNTGYCSTSMLQRKFKIGYTRAARIVDVMEEHGIVGALDGAKPRQVLINKADMESLFGGKLGLAPDNSADGDEDEYGEAPSAEVIEPAGKEEDL